MKATFFSCHSKPFKLISELFCMENEILEKYLKAGKIISEVRKESEKFIKEGELLADISDRIDALVRQKGAEPAFPVCLSINEMAAHCSPGKGDTAKIPEGALIKIDIGAHIDGYVADTAYSIAFNPDHQNIVDASTAGLKAAIEQCYTGNSLENVSEAIENAIKDFGMKPISNLTGHGLGQYWLHDSPSVPNVKTASSYTLKEDQVLALEPFATPGAGRVKDAEVTTIFRIDQVKPVRNPEARKILEFAASINGLPFAERWLPIESLFKIKMALRELREREILHEYPALKEVSGALVSQTEHSIIVKDKPIVFTA
jgi:methionyl aminopeptidase